MKQFNPPPQPRRKKVNKKYMDNEDKLTSKEFRQGFVEGREFEINKPSCTCTGITPQPKEEKCCEKCYFENQPNPILCLNENCKCHTPQPKEGDLFTETNCRIHNGNCRQDICEVCRACEVNRKNQPKVSEWEKEWEKLIIEIDYRSDFEKGTDYEDRKDIYQPIKQFIQNTLDSQKKELVEWASHHWHYDGDDDMVIYYDDFINLIKSK